MSVREFFSNKRVLITGHTGFKGSWLSLWLSHYGAEVHGLSIDIPSQPSNYELSEIQTLCADYRGDVKDAKYLCDTVTEIQPDVIFHLAAQALVRPSYDDPINTITTNALGSANILQAVKQLEKPVTVVMITSDKVYDNVEWEWGYREIDRIGGKDPYSASKGMAELAIRTFVESYFNTEESCVRLGVARAGNVIGGGDWAVDRIVPDCVRAWSEKNPVDIRKPQATRPWQHVLEPLSGYILLAVELTTRFDLQGEAFNFGPSANQNHSVSELIDEMQKHWSDVHWNDTSEKSDNVYESGLLKLNCDKAYARLGWEPTLDFEQTIRMTSEWYKCCYQEGRNSMFDITNTQLMEYISQAALRDKRWI